MLDAESIRRESAWEPFKIAAKAELVRPMTGLGGVEDRLRIVAFAELQARDAFRYGAERFPDIPAAWREDWLRFADVENRHAQMLLNRMHELGFAIGARAVNDKLTRLCRAATDAETFLFLLGSAEERGMEAGQILGKQMSAVDAISAQIFAQIAAEEVEHVASSQKILAVFDIVELRERARGVDKKISEGAQI